MDTFFFKKVIKKNQKSIVLKIKNIKDISFRKI